MSLQLAPEGLLDELARRIRADFEGVWPALVLRFIPYSEWIADDHRTGPTEPEDIVCLTDRGGFPIHVDQGVEVSCSLVASQLQDLVMDDLGRPWPLLECGGVSFVPEPGLDSFGKACWLADGRIRCPVGYLVSTYKAFGLLT